MDTPSFYNVLRCPRRPSLGDLLVDVSELVEGVEGVVEVEGLVGVEGPGVAEVGSGWDWGWREGGSVRGWGWV